MEPPHRLSLKVYMEDTDAQGIVYHANYLKYCERARTEMLAQDGDGLGAAQARGVRYVVHEMHLKYHRPALLEERLEVVTSRALSSPYRLTFSHRIYRPNEPHPLFRAEVQVVAIDGEGKLLKLDEARV